MGPIVTVIEAERLLTVRGIHGGVEVERDDLGAPAEAAPMSVEDRVGDGLDQSIQLHGPRRVLETRDRRLGGQPISVNGTATHEHLVDRIVGELAGVVAIGVSQGDGKQSLLDEFEQTMTDLAGLPSIAQALGELLAQSELLIDGLEQQGATVRGAVLLVEGSNDRLRNQVGKRDSLCGRIRHHEGALVEVKRA